jgi:hypothetical protein
VLVIPKESYACLVSAWKRGTYRVSMKPKTYEKKRDKMGNNTNIDNEHLIELDILFKILG